MTLLELHEIAAALAEMARRRDPAWAVLDWAARQAGDFTVRDAYRVYTAAGGESTEQQFATIFNKWVAKYDPASSKERYRDEGSYGLSQRRPIVVTRVGRRGKGGAATYQWGLDAPLREPPSGGAPAEPDDELGDALDRLEGHFGGTELRAMMARWRRLPDMNAVLRDVTRLPARMHAPAMLVASQHLVSSGRADPEDVGDAERRLADRDARSQVQAGRPAFVPGKPRADVPVRPGARPSPSSPARTPATRAVDDADPSAEWEDDSYDKTDPDAAPPDFGDDGGGDGATPDGTELRVVLRDGSHVGRGTAVWRGGEVVVTDEAGAPVGPNDGIELQPLGDEQFDEAHTEMMEWLGMNWTHLIDPPSEGGPDLEAEIGDGPEAPEGEGAGEYPEWVPYADDKGTPVEQAMHRLFTSGVVPPDDPLWLAVTAAEDDPSLVRIVRSGWGADRPREGMRDMVAVARHGLENAFEPPDDDEAEAEALPDDDGGEAPEVGDDEGGEEPGEPVGGSEWLPRADEDGSPAEAAMAEVLEDMPKARGFEGFDASSPLFSELRAARDVEDARDVLSRAGVPRIMVMKFLRITRAIFANDGRDPDTGEPVNEGIDQDAPDPSRRGPAGVGRLLPMYGMDEGPNTDSVDFAPRSGLSRLMRVVRRDR